MWMRKTANTISGRNAGRSGRGLFAAVLAGAAMLWAGVNSPATAYERGYGYEASVPSGYGVSSNYANPTDALMYPCFGALIYPSPRHCRATGYGYGKGYGYGYGSYASSVSVDCDRDSYREVLYKVRRVRTGGAIYVTGSRCKVSLSINSSLAIIGKPRNGIYPVIEALEGQPCLRAGPSANKVVVRNITFVSSRGQRSSCIESSARELTLVDSNLRYDGEGAAIKIDDGRFNLYNTNVVARTLTAAIDIDRASFYAENSRVASTYNGIVGNIEDDSRVIGLTFMQLGDWQGFVRGEGAKAIDLKLMTSGSVLTIDQLKVLFYGNGLYLSGAGEALISNSLFYSDHAITSSLDRVRILNNYIFADEVGISIDDGQAFVGNNHIQLVRTAGIVAKTDAQLRAVNNHIMTLRCEALRDGDNNRDPAARTCTPWYKDAAFAIPGGGVDWSLNALLEESCLQVPNDPRASNICERYKDKSKLFKDTAKVESYEAIMQRGCATMTKVGSKLDTECMAFNERSKTLKALEADKSLPKADLDDAIDDYDRLTLEGLKRLCFSTDGKKPAAWAGQDVCSSVSRTISADSKVPFEDDETNMEIAANKEWLMRLLYDANESTPSGLYTLSSTKFMPLFDSYQANYITGGVPGRPTLKTTEYFKPKS